MELYPKNKFLQLMWLTWSFCLIGLDNGLLGPSLLDLAGQVNATQSQMNRIFPAQGFGFLMSIMLSTIITKVTCLHLYITLTLGVGAIINVLIPFSTSLGWMTGLFLVQGSTKGLLDTFVYTLCLRLFPGEHNWQMLCIPIAEALSAFLIPFAVKPFQSQVYILPGANITSLTNCTTETCHVTASRIAYPYVFTSIILFPAICAFAYYSVHEKCSNRIEDEYDQMPDSETWSTAKWRENWPIIVLLFFFHIPVFGSIIAFSDLLTLYGSSAPMFLEKGTMAYMTSMFWGCLLIGRLVNLGLSKYVHMGVLLCINFGGLIIFTCLLIAPQTNSAYLWVGTAGFGIFQSSFLPSVITWAGSFLHLDSIVLNVSLLASGIGEVVIPYVAAMIFQNFGHPSLMFLIFTFSIIEVILFSAISYLHWQQKKINVVSDDESS